ncbi:MAG: anthranilate synthase component I [Hyphomicrobiaceae bacterium]|nr:anthranilate synthase component I [Hyphomicrobiaceae bacterium]
MKPQPRRLFDITPSLERFTRTYNAGEPQVVTTRLVADLETPVSAYMKLSAQHSMSFLLESVEGGAVRARYSIIGLAPDIIWRANGNVAEINRSPHLSIDSFERINHSILTSMRDLFDESRIKMAEDLPPMAAGIFGYMGYDMVRLVENLPNKSLDVLGVPDALLIRPTLMVIFDSVTDQLIIVTPVRPSEKQVAGEAFNAAESRLNAVIKALETPNRITSLIGTRSVDHKTAKSTSNTTPQDYMTMVNRAKDYIRAGDIFQVVLSQRFSIPFHLPPFALYRALRRTNPSPFLFHLDFKHFALVGSSPEILVRVRDGNITIRPIAGTARRGANRNEDQIIAEQLLNDPKERAEHLMLLDLGRNDIGRVAKLGSVHVTDKFIVERYSHVMHIVSNVIGKLDNKYNAVDALMAGFPAGTVSGAPKIRAMEIIDELEKYKRGPYAGCVGYFSADGNLDTCIVLRTAIVKDGIMHVQAGAGLVHDSIPEKEQQECINKAKALMRAAEEAVRFSNLYQH